MKLVCVHIVLGLSSIKVESLGLTTCQVVIETRLERLSMYSTLLMFIAYCFLCACVFVCGFIIKNNK